MGSKGQTTTQNQTQSYTPAGGSYIQSALQRAGDTANLPFNIPQAPVAGFSQDQQGAFQQFRDLQGQAQPYYNQAANYYNQSAQGPNVSQFFNPYSQQVIAGMKDIFGAQNTQNTGQLTQAAGGVGADRIGVGQAELARQQDLSAGQTLASLYAPSLQAGLQEQGVLQNAGNAYANLGNQAQGSALQGANALLGTGGLQQQLSQAQLNSPYQQQLAQAAFPYQQAQFLAGITGSLAPGMGGTTNGVSQTTAPGPSIWSQLFGAGTAAAGAYGAYNSGSGGGKGSNSNTGDGSWYGPSSVGGRPLSARGGRIYADGGAVDDNPYSVATMGVPKAFLPVATQPQPPAPSPWDSVTMGVPKEFLPKFAEGGIPNSDPIDVSKMSMIPQVQMQPIQAHVPQLNFSTPPAQQSGSGGPSAGDIAKIAMMFANRGGRVDPFFADGGAPDDEGPIYRMPDQPDGVNPYDTWRKDTPVFTPTVGDGGPSTMSYADTGAGAPASAAISKAAAGVPAGLKQEVADAGGEAAAPLGAQGVSPYARLPDAAAAAPPRERGLSDNPWMALMAAGLGMMGGTSPNAGVNIGQGAMAGLKTLQQQRESAQKDENLDMSARRLAQEAQHHLDSQDIQKQQLAISKKNADKQSWSSAGAIMTKDGLHPAVMESGSGKVIDAVTGKPPTETDTVIPKGGSKNSPEEISNVVDGIIDGSQPPTLTGLYGDSVHVRSGLKAKGFNLAKAQQEWEGAKKQTAAVNSSRMTAYVGLNRSVDKTIDEVRDLSKEMQLGGIPFMNKLELAKYIQTQGNTEKGQLATKYMTAVNTLKEEFANLANGGYAPTEAAWKLANDQVNGNYGMKQLHASIDEIQRLIRYRIQAIPNLATMGPGSTNRYTPSGGSPAAPATTAPAGGSKPDVAKRFNELVLDGKKTEEEAYAILHEEGYQ